VCVFVILGWVAVVMDGEGEEGDEGKAYALRPRRLCIPGDVMRVSTKAHRATKKKN
jgi:hypothetical protein